MVRIKIGAKQFSFDVSQPEHALFLTVGMGMAQIQNFESIVGSIIASLSLQSVDYPSREKALAELEIYDEKTLGFLIRVIKTKFHDDDLSDDLERVRQGRNFMAHHCLRGYPGMTEAECIELMLKIETILSDIVGVQDRLIAVLGEQDVIDISEVHINPETGSIEDI